MKVLGANASSFLDMEEATEEGPLHYDHVMMEWVLVNQFALFLRRVPPFL